MFAFSIISIILVDDRERLDTNLERGGARHGVVFRRRMGERKAGLGTRA
jgi:hypothetical protein